MKIVNLVELEPLVEQSLNAVLTEINDQKQEFEIQQNDVMDKIQNILRDTVDTSLHIKRKSEETEKLIADMEKQQKILAQKIAAAEIIQDKTKAEKLEKELRESIASKTALSLKLEAFDCTEPTISEMERVRLIDEINGFTKLQFDAQIVQETLKRINVLESMIEVYKEKLQIGGPTSKATNFDSALRLIDQCGLLSETFVTKEAQKCIQEGKEENLHNRDELFFIGIWLRDGKGSTFTEFCKQHMSDVLMSQSIIVRKEQMEKERQRQEREDKLSSLYQ